MTTTNPTHAAYLQNESWSMPRFYLGHSAEEAEAKAVAALLSITADDRDEDEFPDDRDEDEFPDDQSWVDCCLEESWALDSGEIVGEEA